MKTALKWFSLGLGLCLGLLAISMASFSTALFAVFVSAVQKPLVIVILWLFIMGLATLIAFAGDILIAKFFSLRIVRS